MDELWALRILSILSSLTATVSLAYLMAAMLRMAHTMRRNRLLALANESTWRLRVLEKLLKNKKRSHRRFWVKPGRMSIWWKHFVKEVVIAHVCMCRIKTFVEHRSRVNAVRV